MLMTTLLKTVAFLLFLDAASLGLTRTEQEALELLNSPKTSTLSILTRPEGAKTLQLLRDIVTGRVTKIGSASLSEGMGARLVLSRLGDTFTLEDTVRRYRSHFMRFGPDEMLIWIMEESKQPKFISLLVTDLDRDESPRRITKSNGMEGRSHSPISVFSGVMIGRVIRKCDQFSPDLKNWTWQMMSLMIEDPAQFRALTKTWWLQNQPLFAREEYGSVQPLNSDHSTQIVASVKPFTPVSTPPVNRTSTATPSDSRSATKGGVAEIENHLNAGKASKVSSPAPPAISTRHEAKFADPKVILVAVAILAILGVALFVSRQK